MRWWPRHSGRRSCNDHAPHPACRLRRCHGCRRPSRARRPDRAAAALARPPSRRRGCHRRRCMGEAIAHRRCRRHRLAACRHAHAERGACRTARRIGTADDTGGRLCAGGARPAGLEHCPPFRRARHDRVRIALSPAARRLGGGAGCAASGCAARHAADPCGRCAVEDRSGAGRRHGLFRWRPSHRPPRQPRRPRHLRAGRHRRPAFGAARGARPVLPRHHDAHARSAWRLTQGAARHQPDRGAGPPLLRRARPAGGHAAHARRPCCRRSGGAACQQPHHVRRAAGGEDPVRTDDLREGRPRPATRRSRRHPPYLARPVRAIRAAPRPLPPYPRRHEPWPPRTTSPAASSRRRSTC